MSETVSFLRNPSWSARADLISRVSHLSVFAIETNHILPDELVSAIRAFLLSPDELAKSQKKESPPKPKLDAGVAGWAKKVIAKREGDYETTIEVRNGHFTYTSAPP